MKRGFPMEILFFSLVKKQLLWKKKLNDVRKCSATAK